MSSAVGRSFRLEASLHVGDAPGRAAGRFLAESLVSRAITKRAIRRLTLIASLLSR